MNTLGNLQVEEQNAEYEGMNFTVDEQTFRSRLAKSTPKKKGYFVVFWEKDENNKNRPYRYEDCPEKVLVNIIDKTQQKRGQFIFTKNILLKHGILQTKEQNGKMAIRVYPDWETELNATAARTQKWQHDYFIDLSDSTDVHFVQQLLSSNHSHEC